MKYLNNSAFAKSTYSSIKTTFRTTRKKLCNYEIVEIWVIYSVHITA